MWHMHMLTLYFKILRYMLVLLLVGFTHWGRMTHICVSKQTIICSDNGLSPGRRQAIIWTNAGILLIRTLGTNVNEILGEIHSVSFSKMRLKMSSAKWRPFCLGLNEFTLNPALLSPSKESWLAHHILTVPHRDGAGSNCRWNLP